MDRNLYVNELIDPISKTWNMAKLQDLIAPEDIPRILGLHPSFSFSRDSYIWAHTKSGNYSVRSGYWAAKASPRGDCDLPFQGPRTDKTCPRCGMYDETIKQVLLECPPTYQRAKELGVMEEAIRDFPWILWFILKAQNSKVFGNSEVHPADTLQLACKEADFFRIARAKESIIDSEPPLIDPGSRSTVSDLLTCQVDGSWTGEGTLCGIGWILISDSQLINLGLKCFRQCLSPLHTEFEALLCEMRLLTSLSIFNVAFETDCKELTQLLDTPDEWPAFASELEDYNALKLGFSRFFLDFIPRLNNVRADCLAKKARARDSIFPHVSSSTPDWFSSVVNRMFLA
ncbi:Ribonuclease H-like superfamily [Arabidopsis suecica]|uniref:Ribonuclease H-like superfamily n=1 Tax=Arabidopsis suecica TaxID=45249 RepID=A0A8T1ZVD3_ARASU|nr:Ribonuclease H-like superfamily [Arabidopsis suecica]